MLINNQDENVKLYAFEKCNAVNLPTGAILLVSKYSSSQLVVNKGVFAALKQCTALRSMQEHAACLAASMPKLNGNVENAIRLLEAVRKAGLLTAASEFVERLRPLEGFRRFPAPSRVFIITCDRPVAVERLLNSMLVGTELALHEGFYLVDDSRGKENAIRNQKLVESFNQQSQVTMHYFGQLERDSLITQLITRSPEHEASIRFLLDQQRWRGYKTYSLSRTICLLLSVGFRSVVLDDDTLCTAIDPPFKSTGVDFNDGMREAAFYPSVEAWHSGSTPREEDPLAGHLRCLGFNIPDALSQLGMASMGAEVLKNSQTQILRRLSASSSVLITQCGTYGDPGTGNTAWCFSLEGESLDRLLSTPPGIEEKVTTRQYWLGRSKPTFSTAAIMSQVTGLDNTAVLPPYFPAGRGQDLLFGAMTQYLHPNSMVLSYDWGIPHLPPEERQGNIDWSMEQNGIRTLSNYIRHHAELNPGVSLENRWRSLVLLLQALSELPDQELAAIYRSQLSMDLSNTARTLTEKLRSTPIEYTEWRLMLESRQKLCFDAISRNEMPVQLSGVPEGMSEHDMWGYLRNYFKDFSLALEAWPIIRQTAASLNTNPY